MASPARPMYGPIMYGSMYRPMLFQVLTPALTSHADVLCRHTAKTIGFMHVSEANLS